TFDDAANYADPTRFYGDGRRVPDLTITRDSSKEETGTASFQFPTLHPIESYPYAETNVATGRLYRRKGAARAPVAGLPHGWAHDDLRAVELIYVEPLLKAGFSVAILSHPFHFERAPAGTYSGELMVSGDVVLTVEAFRQAVADLIGLIS